MKLNRADREGFGAGTFAFALLTALFAFAALITAAQAYSRSNKVSDRVAKLEAGGVIGTSETVALQEFKITTHPAVVKAGPVSFQVSNVGTIVHELVLVRYPSVAALPKVTKPGGERAVGDVDEEAIPEADKAGEAGDVSPAKKVVKSFNLEAGSYVMFCNIDIKNPDGTVTNHFQAGMRATVTVV
jgi:uncharacterized cupredoxin-like copper-binding protein